MMFYLCGLKMRFEVLCFSLNCKILCWFCGRSFCSVYWKTREIVSCVFCMCLLNFKVVF